MVDRTSRPVVPTEHTDDREHRRLLATRANASMPKDGTEGMTAPFRMMQYATADLPDPTLNGGSLVYVTDGPALAYSDGVSWVQLNGADVAADITALQAQTAAIAEVVLATGTFSAQSSVDIPITAYSAYDQIKLVVSNVTETAADEYFCRARFSIGGGFKATANDYFYAASYNYSHGSNIYRGDHTETADGLYSGWINSVAGYAGNYELTLFNPYSTTNYKLAEICSYSLGSGTYNVMYWRSSNICWYLGKIDAVRIFPDSGTFSGRWTLYGIRTQ